RTGLRDWLSADEVAVVARAARGHVRHSRAHAVPAGGGIARELPFGLAQDLDAHGPGGAVLILRGLLREPAACKGYRGGRAANLCPARAAWGESPRSPAGRGGNTPQPMGAGGRVAFLPDPEGVAELSPCLPDETDFRRHSHDPDGFYARN